MSGTTPPLVSMNDADDGAVHGLCPRQPREERSHEQQDDYW